MLSQYSKYNPCCSYDCLCMMVYCKAEDQLPYITFVILLGANDAYNENHAG